MFLSLKMNRQRDQERLKKFGEKIKRLRTKLNLSQDEVVSRCDLTKGNLSNIENGKKDFLFTTLLELAKGLGVTVAELVNDDLN